MTTETTGVVPGAKFPIQWGKMYYAPCLADDGKMELCPVCAGTGKVALKHLTDGQEYEYACPRCCGCGKANVLGGQWYEVKAFTLESVSRDDVYGEVDGHCAYFEGTEAGWCAEVWGRDALRDMRVRHQETHIHETEDEARIEADKLNAVLRKTKGQVQ